MSPLLNLHPESKDNSVRGGSASPMHQAKATDTTKKLRKATMITDYQSEPYGLKI